MVDTEIAVNANISQVKPSALRAESELAIHHRDSRVFVPKTNDLCIVITCCQTTVIGSRSAKAIRRSAARPM